MAENTFISPEATINFYASNERAYRVLLPLWDALKGRQGIFFASPHVHHDNVVNIRAGQTFPGCSPIVVSSFRDLRNIYTDIDPDTAVIMYERENEGNFLGLLKLVSLFVCEEKRLYDLRRSVSENVILANDIQSAAHFILVYVEGEKPVVIDNISGHSAGIIYMAFGDKAKEAVNRSVTSLRRLGYSYPVVVIDEQSWKGDSPFDTTQKKNFQYRAGRIKPFLFQYTPFEFNLYLDADTRILKPIQQGFEMLNTYDIVLTEEKLSLRELYNQHHAGWELNMLERDVTVIETGGDDLKKFVNSGVFFFRQNKKTSKLFEDWHTEWLRFQEWDEQLALMRALSQNNLSVKYLPVEWNSPHLNNNAYIFHNYGRGIVRTNYA